MREGGNSVKMNRNREEPRTTLLIRCTEEEAKAIREAAGLQRRTVSAFVLHVVMNRISIHRRLEAAVPKSQSKLDHPGSSSA